MTSVKKDFGMSKAGFIIIAADKISKCLSTHISGLSNNKVPMIQIKVQQTVTQQVTAVTSHFMGSPVMSNYWF